MPINLKINGGTQGVDAPPDMPLLWAVRDLVGLTGSKYSCGIGQCGACTMLVDGKAVPTGPICQRDQDSGIVGGELSHDPAK